MSPVLLPSSMEERLCQMLQVKLKINQSINQSIILTWPVRLLRIMDCVCHIQCAQCLKTVAPHLKLCVLDRVFVKSSLVKGSPCKLRGVLVSDLLRSPRKIFLGGVPVTLPGVLVSLEGVLVS